MQLINYIIAEQFCRKVWLGLYDSKKDQAEPDSRDEQKIKDFMAQKYERKRWYQAPTDSMKEEARQINESATNRQPPTRQLKTLLGEKTPQLVVKNQVKVKCHRKNLIFLYKTKPVQTKDMAQKY